MKASTSKTAVEFHPLDDILKRGVVVGVRVRATHVNNGRNVTARGQSVLAIAARYR